MASSREKAGSARVGTSSPAPLSSVSIRCPAPLGRRSGDRRAPGLAAFARTSSVTRPAASAMERAALDVTEALGVRVDAEATAVDLADAQLHPFKRPLLPVKTTHPAEL
ncbi:hypothetical protein GCM10010339_84880 [Streptomyces alanosinicus]|uniref:Uncharacterized protein n=1 Tax=Streptomyces alanosinicus TaxID=68171 RepID=A0A919D8Y7_9ACTN|nr:hypothetical protein GCM10010339_84880 [Streptomyces alanosinicus]